MNVLIVILLLAVVFLLAIIAFKGQRTTIIERERDEGQIKPRVFEKDLKELVESMRDREMAEYAARKRKRQPFVNPVMGPVSDDRVHQTNPKAEKILIPENLSDSEKEILKQFFDL